MRLPAWEKSPMYCIGLPWPYSLLELAGTAPCPPVQMEMCTGSLEPEKVRAAIAAAVYLALTVLGSAAEGLRGLTESRMGLVDSSALRQMCVLHGLQGTAWVAVSETPLSHSGVKIQTSEGLGHCLPCNPKCFKRLCCCGLLVGRPLASTPACTECLCVKRL